MGNTAKNLAFSEVFSSWRGERDLRLWRRAPVNSPLGCSVCAHPICFLTIRAQTARSHSRLHPQIPLKVRVTKKELTKVNSFFVSLIYEIAAKL